MASRPIDTTTIPHLSLPWTFQKGMTTMDLPERYDMNQFMSIWAPRSPAHCNKTKDWVNTRHFGLDFYNLDPYDCPRVTPNTYWC